MKTQFVLLFLSHWLNFIKGPKSHFDLSTSFFPIGQSFFTSLTLICTPFLSISLSSSQANTITFFEVCKRRGLVWKTLMLLWWDNEVEEEDAEVVV